MLALLIFDLVARLRGFRMPPVEWMFVGLSIGVPCHELGHVMFAAVGSIPVRLISIGIGPLLWRGRFGETWIELRVLPWAGFVAPYPLVNYRWHWRALFVLGGVLGNAAVICLLAALEAIRGVPPGARDILGAIGFAQVLIIVVAIVPRCPAVRGTRIPTDGMRLLQLLWRPRDEAAQTRAAYATQLSPYSRGNTELTISPASSRVFCDVGWYYLSGDRDARHDLREALLHEVEGGNLAPKEKMFVLDALITDGLVSCDLTVRPYLDEWSRRALALGPELPTLLGSRGAVLVELGRYEEGKALLAPHAAASQAGSLDAFMNRAFLALAERGLGNAAAAQEWANGARTAAQAIEKARHVMAMLARLDSEIPPAKLQ
jgi:hypothetical protein